MSNPVPVVALDASVAVTGALPPESSPPPVVAATEAKKQEDDEEEEKKQEEEEQEPDISLADVKLTDADRTKLAELTEKKSKNSPFHIHWLQLEQLSSVYGEATNALKERTDLFELDPSEDTRKSYKKALLLQVQRESKLSTELNALVTEVNRRIKAGQSVRDDGAAQVAAMVNQQVPYSWSFLVPITQKEDRAKLKAFIREHWKNKFPGETPKQAQLIKCVESVGDVRQAAQHLGVLDKIPKWFTKNYAYGMDDGLVMTKCKQNARAVGDISA
jgi:hypothetical protein